MPDIASPRIAGRFGVLVIGVLALALAGGQAPSPAPTALENSIDLLVRDNKVDSALVLLRDTLTVDSLNPRWHLRLAHLQKLKGQRAARRLWRLGQESGALARMRAVVDSCAGLPRDLARYVEWVWRAGDSLRLAMSLDSVLVRAGQTAWPLTLRAELAVRRHDTLSALDLSRRAIAADSLFAPAWIRLLTASLATGDTSTALAAYERLKTLCPQEPRVLAAGSILAERQGELTRAATRMRRAVEARLRLQRR